MSGVRKEEIYKSSDPVYGTTGHHETPIGANAEEMWHDVNSAVPGTREHAATHPQGAGASGMATGYSHSSATTHHHTGDVGPATGTLHTATNPVTGETDFHKTQIGAKADQMWKDAKQSIPGTTEHKTMHPTGTTMASGATDTGPGLTEDPMSPTKQF